MAYASGYKSPKNPRPRHVTVDGVRVLLTPIPWGWQVVLDGKPIGCVWRCSEHTFRENQSGEEEYGAETIEWAADTALCPEGSDEEQRDWLGNRGGGYLGYHWTRKEAIADVLRHHAKP